MEQRLRLFGSGGFSLDLSGFLLDFLNDLLDHLFVGQLDLN